MPLIFLKFYIVKAAWIFVFVVTCVSTFLLVMYDAEMDELKKLLDPSHSEKKDRVTDKLLADIQSSNTRDRYRSLMVELKRDVYKTEEEVKTLRKQISDLSLRREALKNEVLKQQEDYQRTLNNFTKELENKKIMLSSRNDKSRNPSRFSCFSLR